MDEMLKEKKKEASTTQETSNHYYTGTTMKVDIDIVDDLWRLIWKLWKYRKGGYDKEEAAELADDLMSLAMEIVSQFVEQRK